MTMNINNNTIGRSVKLDSHKNYNNTVNSTPTAKATQDSVNITKQAHDLANIEQASSAAFERSENEANNKIAELKQAINNGTYNIDTNKLASNIFDFESSLNSIYG